MAANDPVNIRVEASYDPLELRVFHQSGQRAELDGHVERARHVAEFELLYAPHVKVSGACNLAGVEVRYPLLSDDLIEFSSHLPPRLKIKGLVLRYFFKKAYRGFLPNETLRKSKHGFGLPFGEWVVSHTQLGTFVRENLENLKSRRLIRAEFIDRLMDSHLPEHPQYYGDMVWLLLMLEQWHQQHRPA